MSEVKVNKISPRTACGTVTMGDSGDTIALGCGASQTGFGRTGTVDWVTTPQTGTVTAASGKGYFVNTTSGGITVNLPAGAAGSIVSIADYLGTWGTNNVTVSADGSEKIAGNTDDAVLKVNGQSVTLVYVDGTQGWLTTADSTENIQAIKYVTATVSGACNTLTTVCTNYKVATFLGPGTFCVSCGGNPTGSDTVDYMVVAGGGAGGADYGGGGGAGGYRESAGTASGCYTVSPLGTCVAALPVSATPYAIVVGGGGASVCGGGNGSSTTSNPGNLSSFSTISSAGGGRGGSSVASHPNSTGEGGAGGSGGGATWCTPGGGTVFCGGAGNTPSVTPSQGFPGGDGRHLGPSYGSQGGGGGATVKGTDQSPGSPSGRAGGAGATSSINATPTTRAGGGGAGDCGAAGPGGGGAGAGPPNVGAAGTCNTGGGGGGAKYSAATGAGGSGIVIIRYKFQ